MSHVRWFTKELENKIAGVDPIIRERVIAHKQAGMRFPQICKQMNLPYLVVSGIIYEHLSAIKLLKDQK